MRESELEKLTRSHWRGDDATFITAWVRAGLRDAVVGKTRALEAMAQHVFTTTYPALAKQGVRWDTDGGNPIVVGHVHDLHNSVTQLCVRFDPENVRAREQAARAKADAEKQAKEKAEAERQAAEDRTASGHVHTISWSAGLRPVSGPRGPACGKTNCNGASRPKAHTIGTSTSCCTPDSEDHKMAENVRLPGNQTQAITHLLSCKTLEDAAIATGVSSRTLYRWLGQPPFVQALARAEGEAIAGATRRLVSLASAAVDALEKVIRDPDSSPPARVRAAGAVLDGLLRLRSLHGQEQRLCALEEHLREIKPC